LPWPEEGDDIVVSLTFVFWMYVVLFGIIGAMRGWAKELLVSFSVILSLTFITLLERYIPFVHNLLNAETNAIFWLRVIILTVLVFFGYQSPNIARFAPKMTREKLQDTLLGIFLGCINGYLIAGTFWFYMHAADYPFAAIIAPNNQTPAGVMALNLLKYMPPRLLGVPAIYFALVLAFVFVLVVFV
jgi:uncharacterized membrane protein required for colicin V production